jgi:hypothetical protein
MCSTKRLPLLLVFSWSLAMPCSAKAQRTPPLIRWQRIRLATTDVPSYRLDGLFVRRTDSALVLSTDTGQVSVLLTDVRGIWVHRAHGGRRSTTLLLSAVGGLALGTAAALVAVPRCHPDSASWFWDTQSLFSDIAGCGRAWFMLGGLLLGTETGLRLSRAHWDFVPPRALGWHVTLGKRVRLDPLQLRGVVQFQP